MLMLKRNRSLVAALLAVIWVLLTSVVAQFYLYPRLPESWGIWTVAGIQILVYGLSAVPILMLMPHVLKLFRAPKTQVIVGLSVIALAVGYALVLVGTFPAMVFNNFVRYVVTAVVEEAIFRGFIWQKSLEAGKSVVFAYAFNIISFSLIHLPYILANNNPPVYLLISAAIGALLCVVRHKCKNLALPSMLHAAFNIAG